jgi:hypothetical protein
MSKTKHSLLIAAAVVIAVTATFADTASASNRDGFTAPKQASGLSMPSRFQGTQARRRNSTIFARLPLRL